MDEKKLEMHGDEYRLTRRTNNQETILVTMLDFSDMIMTGIAESPKARNRRTQKERNIFNLKIRSKTQQPRQIHAKTAFRGPR
jgi:hypothetical protein